MNPGNQNFFTDDQGNRRYCGCRPGTPRFGAPADSVGLVARPRAEWDSVDLHDRSAPILDQGQTFSCVGHAACTAFTTIWSFASRTPHQFSPCYVYGKINGNADQGASLGDGLDLLHTTGICLASEVPEGMILESQFPGSADSTASRFRIDQPVRCNTFDLVATALQNNFPVVLGIQIRDYFATDLTTGELPDPPDGGVIARHAICVIGIQFRDPQWYLMVQNSWPAWGQNGQGIGYMPESYFNKGLVEESWAIIAAQDDPLDPTP